jgi:hypothetical protein
MDVRRATSGDIDSWMEIVHGAALLSRDDQPHVIHRLAVRTDSRRCGVGSLLMAGIMDRWPTGDITVTTLDPTSLAACRRVSTTSATASNAAVPRIPDRAVDRVRSSLAQAQTSSDVEAELHDVPVRHHVVLALHAYLAGGTGGRE